MSETKIHVPKLIRSASATASEAGDGPLRVEMVLSTETPVRRAYWTDNGRLEADEVLSITNSAVDLGRVNSGRAPLLDTHGRWLLADQIGIVEEARIEGGELLATVRISEREELASLRQDIRDGIVRNVSVGYKIHEMEREDRADDVPVMRATRWEVLEASLVPVGADPRAGLRSQDEIETVVTVRSAPTGKVRTMTDDVKAAEVRTEAVDVEAEISRLREDAKAETAAAVAAERKRVSTIRDDCRDLSLGEDFAQKLIDDGTPLSDALRAIVDARRVKDAASPPAREIEVTRDACETQHELAQHAIECMVGLRPERELEGDARKYMSCTMIELARDLAASNNVQLRGTREQMAKKALQRGYGEYSRAGLHSTSDFPYILENVMHKSLRSAYDATPNTFQRFGRREDLPDFRASNLYQLGDMPPLTHVPEGGKFEMGTIGEGKESWQVYKFESGFSYTWEMMVNDDMSAFNRLPSMWGALVAVLEGNAAWYAMLSNPTMGDGNSLFDDTNHSNVGQSSTIDNDSLAEFWKMLSLMTSLDSAYIINVRPRFLIVPPALLHRALQHVRPLQFAPDALTDNPSPITTIWEDVIAEPRLENGLTYMGNTVAGSSAVYYGVGSGPGIDPLVYGGLRGASGPTVSTRQGWEVEGVELKILHTFGAKVPEWRCWVKNAGTD